MGRRGEGGGVVVVIHEGEGGMTPKRHHLVDTLVMVMMYSACQCA